MFRPGLEESDTFYEHQPKLTRRGPSLLAENTVSPDVAKYLSPSRSLTTTGSPSRLSTNERRHYNRALKELCKILTLEGQQLEESQLAEDWKDTSYHSSGFVRNDHLATSDADADVDTDGLTPSLYEDENDNFLTPSAHLNHERKPRRRKYKAQESAMNNDDGGDDRSLKTVLSQTSMQAVYAELATISQKLQEQSMILHERERALQEREQTLKEQLEASFTEQSKATQNARREMTRRFVILQEEHKAELIKMEEILKDKTKENKRVKSSFDTLKQANDVLRQQLDELQAQNKKLETQAVSVQHRLTNLQRRQELSEGQRTMEAVSSKAKADTQKKLTKEMGESRGVGKQLAKPTSQVYSVLGTLLEWVSDVHLMHVSLDTSKPLDSLPAPSLTHERCIKVLPSLVEILHHLPTISTAKIHLPCLQFIYWSIMHIDTGQGSQRTSLSATYRRLGEELYKPSMVKSTSEDGKDLLGFLIGDRLKAAIFYRSPNLHIRFLSSLIILKTLSQVDYLAQVFDTLKSDLKDEETKELFLTYHATKVIIPHMKAANRALVGSAVDICLQMSMESMLMQQFLDTCSTEGWFRACSTMLHTPKLDVKIWEKLSIVLQKLSKVKSNKRYFEVLGISSAVQEMIHAAGPENAFLSLNLRSILFNLGGAKGSPPQQTHL
ncbi:LOW QUALITY PROTEIN: coiled-coil domain-containing protein 138-like [Amphiura filiformis]|uniref:LOW QUALITY PROTEIN: coiled-coil domain-containing protein 138-like n=1 Tax=Amphiura filiformis TaxID=82378 RepID=UPI003B217E48